ncbi:acyl-CoA synthetase [Terasakiella pusilla]|uniref:acyl-CoA synthetase n=1 Tax=Terasakiella pusilla TaxID=64973 RepID=UPI003AA9ABEA
MAFQSAHPIRTIHDLRRLEETPLSDAYDVKSTYDLFVNAADAFQDKVALRFLKDAVPGSPDITLSYRELLQKINQTANLLHSLGVGATDTVSILLPACNDYHLALWGGEAAGIVNPLNPLLNEQKLIDLMTAAQTKVLISYGDDVENGYWDKTLKLIPHVPSLKAVLRVAPHSETTAPALGADQYHFAQEIAKQEDSHLISKRTIHPDDVAAYFHTGGTTGSPKLALHTHSNQVFTAWASVQMQGISAKDKTINGYPLFHVAGVLPGALAALSSGVETIIPTEQLMRNKEVVKNYWKLVDHHKTTTLSAVPTALSAIANVPLKGADISSVTYCRTGAAPLPPELAARYQKLFGLHIHESLGMTEMAGITSISPPGAGGPVGSVGFPVPYSDFKIGQLDEDGKFNGMICPPGQSGMVLIKAPNVFPGYLDPSENSKTFTEDGYLISGDVGFFDEEGRLNLSGRAKDLIIRSGHNIDPKAIEDVLGHHEAVDLCAAVGQPCPYAGELPIAYVTLKKGKVPNESDLLSFIAERIEEAPAKPKRIEIIKTMPQTNVGKIFKPELRRQASEYAVKQMVQELGEVEAILDEKGTLRVTISLHDKSDRPETQALRTELSKLPLDIHLS